MEVAGAVCSGDDGHRPRHGRLGHDVDGVNIAKHLAGFLLLVLGWATVGCLVSVKRWHHRQSLCAC